MNLKESISALVATVAGAFHAKAPLSEHIALPSASARIIHRNAAGEILGDEVVHNVITNSGRDFLHTQGYSQASGVAGGLCYIGLSDDAVSETSASTTLSNEIVSNNMGRAQGTVAHSAGTNTTTVDKTFTCQTAPQAAKKAALFTLSSGGTMCHVLGFTERSLQINDTLQITFTIQLG